MRRFWIIIIISIFSAYHASAQTIEECLTYADRLFSEQDFEGALRQYKRVLFFDESEKHLNLHHRLADCYLATNNQEKALLEYSMAYNVEPNDSIRKELSFKRALIFTLQENYNDAFAELLSLEDSLSDYFAKRRSFYYGIIHLENDSISASKTNFINALNSNDSLSIKKTDSLFRHFHPHRPSPLVAKTLSVFLPGLGQLYVGDYKNSINSILLTGAIAAVFINVGLKYTLFDAMVGVLPHFQRYYLGGIKKVGTAALEKQKAKKEKLLQSMLEVFAHRNKKGITQN